MSVIVQSRDKEPVPNWIRARLLHIRRSLLRRFTNMSVLRPSSITVHPSLQPLLQKTYWNLLSGTDRNVILFSNAFYRVCSDVDRNAANDHQYKAISPLGRTATAARS